MIRAKILLCIIWLLADLSFLDNTAHGKPASPADTDQDLLMPENPLQGRIVFEQKGCITCHAIQGEGGHIGPDLGQRKFYGSFLKLADIMWNHSPEMFRRMRELDLPYPEFTAKEMAELIAYLYYLRYLGEPGDLYRGKILFNEKGCQGCHTIAGKGGKTGPAFDTLGKYVSPIYMAQAMWNHGPEMERRFKEMGLQWPKFQPGEIVDLSAYIRQAGQAVQQERVYMSPGNPQKGEALFKTKGCATCHAATLGGAGVAPDLREAQLDLSVTEIAGMMWNHGSKMLDLMAARKMVWPSFTSREMADLIAYIYFLRFAGKPGNAGRGEKVFVSKGCARCHATKEPETSVGPNLAKSRKLSSPVGVAQILWNHAPLMEEMITAQHMDWPALSEEEMSDLYMFLQATTNKTGR